MAIRKVALMGHPVLREKARPVSEKELLSPKIQELLGDMLETMLEYDGRGLAAPQIHESLRIVVMVWDFDPENKPHVVYLINPVTLPLTEEMSGTWEGCLSVPGLRGMVMRPNKISLMAFNEKKEKVELIVEGFAATVIQHECDHLEGTLYVDRIIDKTQFAFSQEYVRYHAPKEEPVMNDHQLKLKVSDSGLKPA